MKLSKPCLWCVDALRATYPESELLNPLLLAGYQVAGHALTREGVLVAKQSLRVHVGQNEIAFVRLLLARKARASCGY